LKDTYRIGKFDFPISDRSIAMQKQMFGSTYLLSSRASSFKNVLFPSHDSGGSLVRVSSQGLFTNNSTTLPISMFLVKEDKVAES